MSITQHHAHKLSKGRHKIIIVLMSFGIAISAFSFGLIQTYQADYNNDVRTSAQEVKTLELRANIKASRSQERQSIVSVDETATWSFDAPSINIVMDPPPPPPPPVLVPEPAVKAKITETAKSVTEENSTVSVASVPASESQSIAHEKVLARGWSEEDFTCLVKLWTKESGWRVNAENKSSGAYGIPQALPGSKMASAGADWQTNPGTQIEWGLGYIAGRYETPCGAWNASEIKGWY